MIQEKLYQIEPSRASISLLWDGIYNVDELGSMIVPPIRPTSNHPASYNCMQRFLTLTSNSHDSRRPKKLNGITYDETISARISHVSGGASSVTKLKFIPYEQVLIIPVEISGIEEISYITLRIYQGDFSNDSETQVVNSSTQYRNSRNRLVYQERLEGDEVFHLQNVKGFTLEETDHDFSTRIANYWGVEDFANWYHHAYTIEVLIFNQPSISKIPDSEINILKCVEPNYIIACDQLNYNYNFRRKDNLFKWLNDFSRIQRLLRNKRVFFTYLQHIEDYLKLDANAELLEALEFFERQAHFPTIQVIPTGVLPSSTFSQLVTYAYAIYDIGVRSCHGGFTHRLQWHAIIHLITKRHTTAIAEGFNYSALELYCTARSSLFDSTDNPNATFNVDLWRFLFDRFNKYATKNDPQSTLDVKYPEKYDDELHYAEQAYMAFMDLPPDPRITQRFIKSMGDQLHQKGSNSSYFYSLGNNNAKNRFQVWTERYLAQLNPCSNSNNHAFTTDKRLIWGCLISSEEWQELEGKLKDQRIYFHNLSCLASKLQSFFWESVIAVQVVAEFYQTPSLIPPDTPYRKMILRKKEAGQSLANLLEEVAPYARILSLCRQFDDDGQPLFSKITDQDGNSIPCFIRTGSSLLTQKTIDQLKALSRKSLRPTRKKDTRMKGIAFS